MAGFCIRWGVVFRINDELGYIVVKKFEIKPIDRGFEDPKLQLVLTLVSYRIEANHAS